MQVMYMLHYTAFPWLTIPVQQTSTARGHASPPQIGYRQSYDDKAKGAREEWSTRKAWRY